MTRSQQALDCALSALEDVASNKTRDPHSRVNAAKVILDFMAGGGSLSVDELSVREASGGVPASVQLRAAHPS